MDWYDVFRKVATMGKEIMLLKLEVQHLLKKIEELEAKQKSA